MQFFDRAYEGTPLWEIGRPQPEMVRLEEEGAMVGRVVDVGCGTGETTLYLARRGHPVWGIDISPNAIHRAEAKASERGIATTFRVASALDLDHLGATFDTAVDSGLFHVFLDAHRPLYADNVRKRLVPGGRLFLLCFSEEELTDWGGPRRVTQAEIRATFRIGWTVRWIRPSHFEVTVPGVTGKAWLAELRRTPDTSDSVR
ncbi:MAG: class I SAM-dependent methyltransferase [Thermoplasmata archaeon]